MTYLVHRQKILIVPPLHTEKGHGWPVACDPGARLQPFLSSPRRHLFSSHCRLVIDSSASLQLVPRFLLNCAR